MLQSLFSGLIFRLGHELGLATLSDFIHFNLGIRRNLSGQFRQASAPCTPTGINNAVRLFKPQFLFLEITDRRDQPGVTFTVNLDRIAVRLEHKPHQFDIGGQVLDRAEFALVLFWIWFGDAGLVANSGG